MRMPPSGHLLAGLLERGVEVNRCGTSCTTRRGTEEQFATHACAPSDRGRLDGIVRDDRVVSSLRQRWRAFPPHVSGSNAASPT